MLFADLEAHANAAVLNQLTNVLVMFDRDMVPGIFRKPATVVTNLGMGAADTSITLKVASSAVMADPVDKMVVVAGVPYTILTDAPDGTGLTVLTLGAYE